MFILQPRREGDVAVQVRTAPLSGFYWKKSWDRHKTAALQHRSGAAGRSGFGWRCSSPPRALNQGQGRLLQLSEEE